jgi:3',5'-cyclic AMP phosphodiesterase CpdA
LFNSPWKPRRLVAGFLLLLLLVGPSFAYSFVVFGDNQGNYRVLNDLLAKVKREQGLTFIVQTGDFVPYGEEVHYVKYRQIMAKLNIPYYQLMGNHDGVNGGWRLFAKYFGQSYYSFDYQGDRFIFLNNAFRESFDRAQFDWLKQELAREGAQHKFVFMHKPAFDPSEIYKDHVMSGRAVTEELERLFSKYKVDRVFAGHIHGYAKTERGGVIYSVSGGGGGPLHLPPNLGGFYHYLRIDVNGDRISDKIVRVYE